jgi:hypothetical protein
LARTESRTKIYEDQKKDTTPEALNDNTKQHTSNHKPPRTLLTQQAALLHTFGLRLSVNHNHITTTSQHQNYTSHLHQSYDPPLAPAGHFALRQQQRKRELARYLSSPCSLFSQPV